MRPHASAYGSFGTRRHLSDASHASNDSGDSGGGGVARRVPKLSLGGVRGGSGRQVVTHRPSTGSVSSSKKGSVGEDLLLNPKSARERRTKYFDIDKEIKGSPTASAKKMERHGNSAPVALKPLGPASPMAAAGSQMLARPGTGSRGHSPSSSSTPRGRGRSVLPTQPAMSPRTGLMKKHSAAHMLGGAQVKERSCPNCNADLGNPDIRRYHRTRGCPNAPAVPAAASRRPSQGRLFAKNEVDITADVSPLPRRRSDLRAEAEAAAVSTTPLVDLSSVPVTEASPARPVSLRRPSMGSHHADNTVSGLSHVGRSHNHSGYTAQGDARQRGVALPINHHNHSVVTDVTAFPSVSVSGHHVPFSPMRQPTDPLAPSLASPMRHPEMPSLPRPDSGASAASDRRMEPHAPSLGRAGAAAATRSPRTAIHGRRGMRQAPSASEDDPNTPTSMARHGRRAGRPAMFRAQDSDRSVASEGPSGPQPHPPHHPPQPQLHTQTQTQQSPAPHPVPQPPSAPGGASDTGGGGGYTPSASERRPRFRLRPRASARTSTVSVTEESNPDAQYLQQELGPMSRKETIVPARRHPSATPATPATRTSSTSSATTNATDNNSTTDTPTTSHHAPTSTNPAPDSDSDSDHPPPSPKALLSPAQRAMEGTAEDAQSVGSAGSSRRSKSPSKRRRHARGHRKKGRHHKSKKNLLLAKASGDGTPSGSGSGPADEPITPRVKPNKTRDVFDVVDTAVEKAAEQKKKVGVPIQSPTKRRREPRSMAEWDRIRHGPPPSDIVQSPPSKPLWLRDGNSGDEETKGDNSEPPTSGTFVMSAIASSSSHPTPVSPSSRASQESKSSDVGDGMLLSAPPIKSAQRRMSETSTQSSITAQGRSADDRTPVTVDSGDCGSDTSSKDENPTTLTALAVLSDAGTKPQPAVPAPRMRPRQSAASAHSIDDGDVGVDGDSGVVGVHHDGGCGNESGSDSHGGWKRKCDSEDDEHNAAPVVSRMRPRASASSACSGRRTSDVHGEPTTDHVPQHSSFHSSSTTEGGLPPPTHNGEEAPAGPPSPTDQVIAGAATTAPTSNVVAETKDDDTVPARHASVGSDDRPPVRTLSRHSSAGSSVSMTSHAESVAPLYDDEDPMVYPPDAVARRLCASIESAAAAAEDVAAGRRISTLTGLSGGVNVRRSSAMTSGSGVTHVSRDSNGDVRRTSGASAGGSSVGAKSDHTRRASAAPSTASASSRTTDRRDSDSDRSTATATSTKADDVRRASGTVGTEDSSRRVSGTSAASASPSDVGGGDQRDRPTTDSTGVSGGEAAVPTDSGIIALPTASAAGESGPTTVSATTGSEKETGADGVSRRDSGATAASTTSASRGQANDDDDDDDGTSRRESALTTGSASSSTDQDETSRRASAASSASRATDCTDAGTDSTPRLESHVSAATATSPSRRTSATTPGTDTSAGDDTASRRGSDSSPTTNDASRRTSDMSVSSDVSVSSGVTATSDLGDGVSQPASAATADGDSTPIGAPATAGTNSSVPAVNTSTTPTINTIAPSTPFAPVSFSTPRNAAEDAAALEARYAEAQRQVEEMAALISSAAAAAASTSASTSASTTPPTGSHTAGPPPANSLMSPTSAFTQLATRLVKIAGSLSATHERLNSLKGRDAKLAGPNRESTIIAFANAEARVADAEAIRVRLLERDPVVASLLTTSAAKNGGDIAGLLPKVTQFMHTVQQATAQVSMAAGVFADRQQACKDHALALANRKASAVDVIEEPEEVKAPSAATEVKQRYQLAAAEATLTIARSKFENVSAATANPKVFQDPHGANLSAKVLEVKAMLSSAEAVLEVINTPGLTPDVVATLIPKLSDQGNGIVVAVDQLSAAVFAAPRASTGPNIDELLRAVSSVRQASPPKRVQRAAPPLRKQVSVGSTFSSKLAPSPSHAGSVAPTSSSSSSSSSSNPAGGLDMAALQEEARLKAVASVKRIEAVLPASNQENYSPALASAVHLARESSHANLGFGGGGGGGDGGMGMGMGMGPYGGYPPPGMGMGMGMGMGPIAAAAAQGAAAAAAQLHASQSLAGSASSVTLPSGEKTGYNEAIMVSSKSGGGADVMQIVRPDTAVVDSGGGAVAPTGALSHPGAPSHVASPASTEMTHQLDRLRENLRSIGSYYRDVIAQLRRADMTDLSPAIGEPLRVALRNATSSLHAADRALPDVPEDGGAASDAATPIMSPKELVELEGLITLASMRVSAFETAVTETAKALVDEEMAAAVAESRNRRQSEIALIRKHEMQQMQQLQQPSQSQAQFHQHQPYPPHSGPGYGGGAPMPVGYGGGPGGAMPVPPPTAGYGGPPPPTGYSDGPQYPYPHYDAPMMHGGGYDGGADPGYHHPPYQYPGHPHGHGASDHMLPPPSPSSEYSGSDSEYGHGQPRRMRRVMSRHGSSGGGGGRGMRHSGSRKRMGRHGSSNREMRHSGSRRLVQRNSSRRMKHSGSRKEMKHSGSRREMKGSGSRRRIDRYDSDGSVGRRRGGGTPRRRAVGSPEPVIHVARPSVA